MSDIELSVETWTRTVQITRRRFLLGAASSFAGVGLWASGLLPVAGFAPQRSIADLHFADFNTLVGEHFRFYSPARLPITVQLVAVKNRAIQAANIASPRQELFSLAFSAPRDQMITQGTYSFAHSKLGYFDLFIVPAQPTEDEERFIAIINRI
jgi:hypothetical protein